MKAASLASGYDGFRMDAGFSVIGRRSTLKLRDREDATGFEPVIMRFAGAAVSRFGTHP